VFLGQLINCDGMRLYFISSSKLFIQNVILIYLLNFLNRSNNSNLSNLHRRDGLTGQGGFSSPFGATCGVGGAGRQVPCRCCRRRSAPAWRGRLGKARLAVHVQCANMALDTWSRLTGTPKPSVIFIATGKMRFKYSPKRCLFSPEQLVDACISN